MNATIAFMTSLCAWQAAPAKQITIFREKLHKTIIDYKMVRPARFELATYGFEVRHSIQLSYGRIYKKTFLILPKKSALARDILNYNPD